MGKRKTGKKVIDLGRERRIRDNIQKIKDLYADDSTALKRLTDKLESLPDSAALPTLEEPVSESPIIKCNPSIGRRQGQNAGKSLIDPLAIYKEKNREENEVD